MDPEILRTIDDFIGEEIYSALEDSEKKMMKVACLFDRPFEANALFIEEDLNFDTLLALRNKSLIRMIGDGRYVAHEVIRAYFRRILTPTERERFARGILPHLLEQGRKAKTTYRNDDAIGYFSNVLELQVEDGGQLEALEGLGEVHELIGQYDLALERYASALGLSPEADVTVRIQRRMARVRISTGNAKAALETLEEARKRIEDEKSLEAGKLRLALSQALHSLHRSEESRAMAHEAIDILKGHRGQEDEIGKAHSILGLSYIFGEPQDLQKAERHLLESLDLRRRADSLKGEGATQNNLGILYVNLGDGDKALKHLNEGVKLAEETGSFYTSAKLTLTTGCAHYELLGDFDEGERHFKKAIRIAEEVGDDFIQCIAYRHLSRVCRYKEDLEGALGHSTKYLELAEKNDYANEQMNAHLERAKEFLAMGRLSDAKLSCKTASELAKKLDAKSQAADCVRVEGAILRTEGNLEESREALERAVALLEEIGDEHLLAPALYDYALLWKAMGETKKAQDFGNRACGIFEKQNLRWLVDKIKRDLG